jgi:hypothetical protein
MPDPYERHSRNAWEWGPNPARSQSRAAAAAEPVVKRPPAKKDPSRCKAAHWKGPHTPALRRRTYGWRRDTPCRWDVSWAGDSPAYFCEHEAFCSGCGKVLATTVGFNDCPDSSPLTDEQRAALEAEIERRRLRRAARVRRVADGPQGYRKKRD